MSRKRKFPEKMKLACDNYIQRVLDGGDEIEKSIEFCKERKLFYRTAIARANLSKVDQRECSFQLKKLDYILQELSRRLDDRDLDLGDSRS